jgi:hypothetical protein
MAYYAREDFFHNPELIEKSVEVFMGNLSLDWADVGTERVRCRPSHPDRGLTYDDTNVGTYGWDQIPEKIRHNFSMAPRGAFMPEGLPHLGYDINRKSEVWSDNCAELYEESKSRHWTPTRLVPWQELESPGHSDERERALAQLYTDLTSMATVLELLRVIDLLDGTPRDLARRNPMARLRLLVEGGGVLGPDLALAIDVVAQMGQTGRQHRAPRRHRIVVANFLGDLIPPVASDVEIVEGQPTLRLARPTLHPLDVETHPVERELSLQDLHRAFQDLGVVEKVVPCVVAPVLLPAQAAIAAASSAAGVAAAAGAASAPGAATAAGAASVTGSYVFGR